LPFTTPKTSRHEEKKDVPVGSPALVDPEFYGNSSPAVLKKLWQRKKLWDGSLLRKMARICRFKESRSETGKFRLIRTLARGGNLQGDEKVA